MMWHLVCRFPIELVAFNVVAMLDLQALIRMQKTCANLGDGWRDALSMLKPLRLSSTVSDYRPAQHWIIQHKIRFARTGLAFCVPGDMTEFTKALVNLVETTCVSVTPPIKTLPTNEVQEKILLKACWLRVSGYTSFSPAVGDVLIKRTGKLSELIFDDIGEESFRRFIDALWDKNPNICEIRMLAAKSPIQKSLLERFKRYGAMLTGLSLCAAALNAEITAAIAISCPNLTAVIIDTTTERDDLGVIFALHCPLLRYLRCGGMMSLFAVRTILEHCPAFQWDLSSSEYDQKPEVTRLLAEHGATVKRITLRVPLLGDLSQFDQFLSAVESAYLSATFLRWEGATAVASRMVGLQSLDLYP
jgi:hypothetical protein